VEWTTTSTVLRDLRDYEHRAAWDRFASRFRRPIVSFACSLGLSSVDAEDVAQESLIAFAEAFRRGQYNREKGRLSQWLFGIAYRQALGRRRDEARRTAKQHTPASESGFLAALPDEPAASVSWDDEWERHVLQECLERVRREVEPSTFRAFELVMREDRSADEAARELGVPIKLVCNAKHRILKRIRELLPLLEETW